MSREPTRMEKLVFGETVKIDPNTDLPIEQGIGAIAPDPTPAQPAPAHEESTDAPAH